MSLNDLPPEIVLRIFSMLDYRHLASVAQGMTNFRMIFIVCRIWNYRSAQADLWQPLYERRWGKFNNSKFKSWKAAYEASDRCERIGMDMKITREGLYYFLVHKGELMQFLGSCKNSVNDVDKTEDAEKELSQVPQLVTIANNGATSQEGLVDKLFFFLGDLEYATREPKRNRVS